METTYYNLNARKVKVSGGADMTTFVPVAVPAPAPRQQSTGEVLDFARCRQRLETKAAWQDLARAGDDAPQAQPRVRSHPSRAQRAQNALEVLATLAVLAVSLCATVAFIALV